MEQIFEKIYPFLSCPGQPHPLFSFPRLPPKWVEGLQPSSYTSCQPQALFLKPPLSTVFPLNSTISNKSFTKNKIDMFVTLDALLPPEPCLLFPSPLSNITQQICVGIGGFASQNFVCKSFFFLKGLISFSVSTLYQLHALSTGGLMSVQVSQQLWTAPHHRYPDTQWISVPKSDHSAWKFQLQYHRGNHFFIVYIYLVPFQSIHLNQVIVF